MVESVKERYALIGGKSPLVDIVTAQAAALARELGPAVRVYAGFRHSVPSIAESYARAVSEGAQRIIAISLSPYETEVTTGSYKKVFEALAIPERQLHFVASFHDNPLFIRAWQENIGAVVPAGGAETALLFTSHSIPLRCIDSGDPYKSQVEESVALVTKGLPGAKWIIGWQSRGARATEPWIGPDVESVLDTMAASGIKNVVEVPIGFTGDHLETLYDIDIVHKKHAEALGLLFKRVPSLNTYPPFIRALADIVKKVNVL
jgi:ferrochelatase